MRLLRTLAFLASAAFVAATLAAGARAGPPGFAVAAALNIVIPLLLLAKVR